MHLLQATPNKYGGLFIGFEDLPENSDLFASLLQDSLREWAEHGIKLVWLGIPSARAELVPIATATGFAFHHCTRELLMLTRRLDPDAVVPPFASRTIGAGAVVISAAQQVLTVLERYELNVRPQYWKLPGGMIEPGEYLADGIVREVREETGIEAQFDGILGLRHHHRGQFGTSNIYFICKLTPLSEKITLDTSELAKATWMSVQDYLNNTEVGPLNKQAVKAALTGTPLPSIKIDGYMDEPSAYEVFFTDM